MNFTENKRQPIYKHTHFSAANFQRAKALEGLFESAFQEPLKRFQHGNRQRIGNERVKFAAEQFANRERIAHASGFNALNEDANIFGRSFPQFKQLFESYSTPENIIGRGPITNPMTGGSVTGGYHNPGYRPGSGDVPSYVFGLQSQLALHCQSFDLLPTIAVDTPKVVINFVDTVYGGGKFTEKENLPSFISVTCPLFTYAWIKSSKLVRSVSKVVVTNTAGTHAMELLFVVGSTISAALTVEVLKTGTYASGTFTATKDFSIKDVVDKLNADKDVKVYIAVDGGVSYTDANLKYTYNNTTNVYDSAPATAQTVNVDYASATRTNIAEAASNDRSIGGMSRAQHEKGPKHKLNIVAFDKQLEMNGIEIEADTNNIEIKDLAASGINAIAMLYAGVQNQLIQTLDEIVLDHLYKLGVQHAVNVYESQEINYSLYIDSLDVANQEIEVSKIDVDFFDLMGNDVRGRMGKLRNAITGGNFENQQTHANRLYQRLLLVSEFVYQQNRLQAPEWIVVGGEIAACLKHHAKYSACPVVTNLSNQAELYYEGTIFETISVYKNTKTAFNDPRILFGVRGDDTTPGCKLLAYDLAGSRHTIAEGTMADKIRVWSRFALCDVGFYPELNYYCMLAINKGQWA